MCIKINQASQIELVKILFRVISRLGDGIFWYVLMLFLLLSNEQGALIHVLQMIVAGLTGTTLYKWLKRKTSRPRPYEVHSDIWLTGTPLDRSIYVSLEGVEALHVDWKNGAAPTHGHEISAEEISKEHLHVHAITAFFVGAKSRIESLKIQREINEFADEPLMAIIPAVTLNELWEGLSYAEGVLRLISVMVVVISFIAMLIALMTTLNERRREMAILRAVGANTQQIGGLLVFESALLSFLGIVLGVGLSLFLMLLLEPWLQSKFGLYLKDGQFSQREFAYIGGVFVVGTLIGLIPALSAQKRALKDGLSVRV